MCGRSADATPMLRWRQAPPTTLKASTLDDDVVQFSDSVHVEVGQQAFCCGHSHAEHAEGVERVVVTGASVAEDNAVQIGRAHV